ncbi:MAG: ketosynthase [Steroidobacteraceae bacterium]
MEFFGRVEELRGSLIALGLACALLAHLAVEAASPGLTAAGIALAAVVVLSPALSRGSLRAWSTALAIAGGLAFAASRRWIWLPLYAPPVLGDAFAAWLFGRTLAAGRMPLIESLIRRMHDEPDRALDHAIAQYARKLTAAWAVLLGMLGAASLALALLARPNGVLILLGFAPPLTVPQTTWSWFANVAEYGIVAGFFVLEYAYRRMRFPQQPHSSFLEFIAKLRTIAPSSRTELDSRVARPSSRTEPVE